MACAGGRAGGDGEEARRGSRVEVSSSFQDGARIHDSAGGGAAQGGPGDDVPRGIGTLAGGPGADVLIPTGKFATVSCADHAQRIELDLAADDHAGAPGEDDHDPDRFEAEGGADQLRARDASRDLVECQDDLGPPLAGDHADVDSRDVAPRVSRARAGSDSRRKALDGRRGRVYRLTTAWRPVVRYRGRRIRSR